MIWLIGLGGALGAAARYLISDFIKNRYTALFPLGTWIVNLTGSFLLGLLAGLYLENGISDGLWLFWGAGFCGAFTTFSTFGHETVSLLQSGEVKTAGGYVAASIVTGIGAAAFGLWI
ncbi:fluoride efflux transporter CrcB [Lentibacillus salicampi]|uniref:Fluoride-specific ion channel FluC n=1 Tax=Lentibacillus salicampi TaxID=175306 RepID=A0A4Y9A8X9_9BACI|nr:fluoride efflux transporter CrcB [Lentibacillus salicampi]TFJ91895.1 fluoride efflux transporter CrcB [Lentibacillus salicampi]